MSVSSAASTYSAVESIRDNLESVSLDNQSSYDVSERSSPPINSALWHSMEAAASSPRTLCVDVAKSVVGPRQLKGDKPTFKYWFDTRRESADTPFVVEFLALLDLEHDKPKQMYGRTGPYFNLHPNASLPITEKDLLNRKVIFSLKFLSESLDEYPRNAIDNSKLTQNFLHLAYLESEAKLGQEDKGPEVTPFMREEKMDNSWRLPVQSKPIFSLPEIGLAKELSLESLDDEELMSAISTPSNMKQYLSSQVRSPAGAVTLADMPDPEDRYNSFISEDPRHGSIIVGAPPVYDEEGDLIHPKDYQKKLKHMVPVYVKAVMRLFTIKRPGANKSTNTSSMPSFERRAVFGSRNYQMVLSEMKFLRTTSPMQTYMPQVTCSESTDTDIESDYEGDDDDSTGYHTPS